MTTDVRIADQDAVRTLTIDRPSSRNGLTPEIVRALRDSVRDAPASIRAFVVTGANGAFCSGLDLKDAMARGTLAASDELERGLREDFHGMIRALAESDRPTIALVDGVAAGYGCDLALACDLRICSERTRFGEIFVKRGLMPDGGGTYHLPRIVGLGRALEMLFTGDIVESAEAYRIGLANKLVDSGDIVAHTQALAARIAAGPPLVHRMVKRAVRASLDGDLAAALDREATGQLQLLRSKDFLEGVSAFLQKRDPKFTGE